MKKILPFLIICIQITSCISKTSNSETIDLEELTIADIHQAYKNGDYNSQQLVQAYIDRIEQHDHRINSISFIDSSALAQAKSLDEEFQRTGELRPLHGIPLIIKDNINVAGIPTTAGSIALQGYVPKEDAFIINKLRNAGVIILAKSNMAEWAFSPMHSESSTEGITRNPYHTDHVPAGSSGGTGAAIAANFGTIGLGTDTGNSIRGPSSHNALVGFRTTLGLVSRSAIVPLYLRNDVVGPMCRTVEDATKVLDAIAGYDTEDPITRYSEGKIPASYTSHLQPDGLQGARIGVLRELSEEDVDPDIKILFEEAIKDLDSLGAELIDPLIINGFSSLRQNQWCASFREDLESFLVNYVRNDTISTLEDIIRIGSSSEFARNRLSRNAANEGRWENPEIPCQDAYEDKLRIAFRSAIEHAMDSLNIDAIIYPSWNHKPARIDRFAEDYKGDNSQIISPHTGQPAFTVPMGFTPDGFPAGLQFLGRMYDEPTLVKLLYAYEQGTRHRKPALME